MHSSEARRLKPLRWAPVLSPEVRNACLVLFAALAAGLLGAPAVVVTGLVFVGLLLAAWAVRQRGAELAGPMFFYDLVRLSRRGRSTLLRFSYAVLLLGVLYWIYWLRFPREAQLENLFRMQPKMRPEALAHFGGTFATAIFALQSAAVLVLTPVYVAGTITEEKERRTLELLFTTHLTDREIILGKMFGRLMHLFGIVLAGLPILMALQVWGGVEPLLPFAGFAVTLLTLLSVGAICIRCSVACRETFTALVVSYLIVVPIAVIGLFVPGCFFSSPVAFMMSLEMQLGAGQLHEIVWPVTAPGFTSGKSGTEAVVLLTIAYAVPHALIAAFCAWTAVLRLRDRELPPSFERLLYERWLRQRDPVEEKPAKRRARPIGSAVLEGGWDPVEEEFTESFILPRPKTPRPLHHPVTDSPLLWKEVYHQAGESAAYGFSQVYLPGLAGLVVLLLTFLSMGLLNEWGKDPARPLIEALYELLRNVVNPVIRGLSLVLAFAWCVGAAWRTASSISRERDGRTLGALLTLPVARSAILGAKWCGGTLRLRWLGYALAALWTVGVLCGALHPAAVLLLAAAVAVHLVFLASLGVGLSLASRNTFWANFSMTLMLLLVFAGSWVATAYYELFFGELYPSSVEWGEHFYQIGLSPLRTWWYLGFDWQEFQAEVLGPGTLWGSKFSAVLAGVGTYAVLAGLLWLEACRQFRKVGGR